MKLTKAYLGSTEITKAYLNEVIVISDPLGPELVDYSLITSSSATFSQDGNGLWVFDDGGNGFLTMPNINANVGDVFNVDVKMDVTGVGNANFRITKGNAQTVLFNYTDFPDGVTEFQATVTGSNGFLDRIFFPASLNDVPNTLMSLSIKKVL